MSKKTTAMEKLHKKKEPKKVLMDKNFAGIKAGEMMYVATPLIVDEYIRNIPVGVTKTQVEIRDDLAKQNECDGTCAISTAIFVRMVAEAAIEEMDGGKPPSEVAPFWRAISAKDKIAGKIKVDPEWLDTQRAIEATV